MSTQHQPKGDGTAIKHLSAEVERLKTLLEDSALKVQALEKTANKKSDPPANPHPPASNPANPSAS